MMNEPTDDKATTPSEGPSHEDPNGEPLSEQQLEDVAGAGDGRHVIDCEGYTALTGALLNPSKTVKSE